MTERLNWSTGEEYIWEAMSMRKKMIGTILKILFQTLKTLNVAHNWYAAFFPFYVNIFGKQK